jgi:hypothetical protein
MSEHERIQEAYLLMAGEAKYRPAAPGDGCGGIDLSPRELKDPRLLAEEAIRYASAFIKEEDSLQFHIGVSNYSTNRALVLTIEAARLLCGALDDERALKLLRMAASEVESAIAKAPKFS